MIYPRKVSTVSMESGMLKVLNSMDVMRGSPIEELLDLLKRWGTNWQGSQEKELDNGEVIGEEMVMMCKGEVSVKFRPLEKELTEERARNMEGRKE